MNVFTKFSQHAFDYAQYWYRAEDINYHLLYKVKKFEESDLFILLLVVLLAKLL